MPELITCPSCALRHTKRPNSACPRCQASTEGVEPSVTMVPKTAVTPATSSPSPASPSLGSFASPSAPALGGLAQSARAKQVNSARATFLVIGILTLLVQGGLYMNADNEVQTEIDKQIHALPAGQVADPAKVAELKTEWVGIVHAIYGGGALVGLLFVVLGAMLSKYPVPVTIAGLVLYLGSTAVFGYLSPETLARGLLIKIIIVTGLFKAMQAAIAQQKEDAAKEAAA